MDIPQRTMNAVGKRDESIRRWLNSSTARAIQKTDDTHFKITFDNGSMLLSAVSSGDIEEVVRLLQLGTDVNYASADGLTSLHQACIDENLDLVEILVKSGANINARDNEGWTPLHAAASTTSLDIVDYLVKNGANLSAVNTDGELAVDLTDEDDIKEFLMDEISIKKINLKLARNLEHDKMMKDVMEWISKGYTNEVRDPQGASALHVAASKSYMDIMELLVERLKIDINIKDNDGWTPLHAAVYWKQLDAIAYLLKHDADYQAKTTIGLLPIDLADDDIILKYKAMLRSKNVSVSYSKKPTTTDDSNEDNIVEVFPHSYKPLPNPILKKISDINVDTLAQIDTANPTKIPSSNDKISTIATPKHTITTPMRPPARPTAITTTAAAGATTTTTATTVGNISIDKNNTRNNNLESIKLPPTTTLSHPPTISTINTTTTSTHKNIPSNLVADISTIKHPPRPTPPDHHISTPTRPPTINTTLTNMNVGIKTPNNPIKPGTTPSRPPTTISSSSPIKDITSPMTITSIGRPPLPTRLDTTTKDIKSSISSSSASASLSNQSTPTANSISILKYKTMEEAAMEIDRLNKLVESIKKDKELLEVQLNTLKLSISNNSATSSSSSINVNTQYLLQENKRLQQENATLIRAMSTLNKSKIDTKP